MRALKWYHYVHSAFWLAALFYATYLVVAARTDERANGPRRCDLLGSAGGNYAIGSKSKGSEKISAPNYFTLRRSY